MRSEHAACDAGPLIHLHEIARTGCFSVFGRIYIPEPVLEETIDKGIGDCIRRKKIFEVVPLRETDKIPIEYTAHRFALSIPDASVVHFARARATRFILTDDLGLREVARNRGLQPVGSVGILLRAFREKMLPKQEAIASLDDLMVRSSLFITPTLINKAKDAVREFR